MSAFLIDLELLRFLFTLKISEKGEKTWLTENEEPAVTSNLGFMMAYLWRLLKFGGGGGGGGVEVMLFARREKKVRSKYFHRSLVYLVQSSLGSTNLA